VWVHVHKHENLIVYLEHVLLVNYDIHHSMVFPGFSLKQYFKLMGDKIRIFMSFNPLLKSGITSLLLVPCCGNSLVVRKCVRFLLFWIHF